MKRDILNQYIHLQKSLFSEKLRIEQRLSELNRILGGDASKGAPGMPIQRGRKPSKARNVISLRDATLQVTAGKALTKAEIVQAVKKIGYQFKSSNPANSLGVVLYGNKTLFKNEGGKFTAIGGAAPKTNSPKPAQAKRKMSASGRAKIAAAQKARWAKIKSAAKAAKASE